MLKKSNNNENNNNRYHLSLSRDTQENLATAVGQLPTERKVGKAAIVHSLPSFFSPPPRYMHMPTMADLLIDLSLTPSTVIIDEEEPEQRASGPSQSQ